MAILKRRNKSKYCYYVRVRDNHGQFFPSKSFSRKVDAEKHERHLLDLRDKGFLAETERSQKQTFRDYWDEWSETMRSHVSEGWKKSQNQMARDHILPAIGKLKLGEIKPTNIQKALNECAAKGLGEQTLLHIYNLMHKMFEDACEISEYLMRNPVLKKFKPKLKLKRRKRLKPAEVFRLLEACKDHYLGPAIWLAALSGLRTEAIQALTWDCVDFESGLIEIKQAFKRKINKIEPYPKGQDHEIVPMPALLATYLRVIKDENRSNFVACGAQGGLVDYSKLYKGVRAQCVLVEVPLVTLHELRHSCTEIWIREGATIEDVRRLLNHKSSKTTERYIHRTSERLNQIARRIDPKKLSTDSPSLHIVN